MSRCAYMYYYDTNKVHIISTMSENVKYTPIRKKVYSKIDKNTVDMKLHRLNAICMYNFDMGSGDVACNIVHIIVCIIGSGGGTYFFGNLEDLRQIHTSYIGGGSI